MSGLMTRALEAVRPARYYESLVAVDPVELAGLGIKGLIIDLDSTMLPRRVRVATEELAGWLERVREEGLKACIVSNNFRTRVQDVADALGLPLVARAAKPRAKAFVMGMEALGTTPAETAVIGDQLFTDVFGGNRMGLTTILVIPLPGPELPHTLVLRRIERRLLRFWMTRRALRLERAGRERGDGPRARAGSRPDRETDPTPCEAEPASTESSDPETTADAGTTGD